MREIKFRAWNEAENKMYYEIEDIRPRYKVYLMQYTGLKDKNGKEIYEGDILRWSRYCLGSKYSTDDVYENKTFYWNNGMWSLDGEKNWCLGIYNDIEVIGNIYENPELLSSN